MAVSPYGHDKGGVGVRRVASPARCREGRLADEGLGGVTTEGDASVPARLFSYVTRPPGKAFPAVTP